MKLHSISQIYNIFFIESNISGFNYMDGNLSEQYLQLKALILNSSSIDEVMSASRLPNFRSRENSLVGPSEMLKLNQAVSVVEDIKLLIEKERMYNLSEILFKAYLSKNDEIICFLSCLKRDSLNCLRNLRIFGLFGRYNNSEFGEREYFLMEAGVKLHCRDTPIEIKTINAGKLKRLGRGTLGLTFLEERVIPALNVILEGLGHKEKIGYIYGISAELSEDTNTLGRAKFYSKNGFRLINSHFYKYLK
jgi:hypothetical protein